MTKAVRAELAAAVAAKEEAVAAARGGGEGGGGGARKAVVDEQLRARALELGRRKCCSASCRAAERSAAAGWNARRCWPRATSRAQEAVTMAKKGGEIEALRAQAAGMAAALTKYATMEAAWVEEREEGARKHCEAEEASRAREDGGARG